MEKRIDVVEFQKDIQRYFRDSPKFPFLTYNGQQQKPLQFESPENYKLYNGIGSIDTLIVKVGTSIVTHDNSFDGEYNMGMIANDLSRLRKRGMNVLLITSGAIGLGRKAMIGEGKIITEEEKDNPVEKQRTATIGQPILYDLWWQNFRINYEQETREFLVVNKDFIVQEKIDGLIEKYKFCLKNEIIPIINEHDAKSISEIETELKGEKVFRDNDGLASLHARMLKDAGYKPLLLLLSNTDGIYTPESFADKSYEPIRIVKNAQELENGVSPESSSRGRGGVISKIEVGRELADLGITTIIANGQYCNHKNPGTRYNVLDSILAGRVVGTRFFGH